jgi:hypothetical protein
MNFHSRKEVVLGKWNTRYQLKSRFTSTEPFQLKGYDEMR